MLGVVFVWIDNLGERPSYNGMTALVSKDTANLSMIAGKHDDGPR